MKEKPSVGDRFIVGDGTEELKCLVVNVNGDIIQYKVIDSYHPEYITPKIKEFKLNDRFHRHTRCWDDSYNGGKNMFVVVNPK